MGMFSVAEVPVAQILGYQLWNVPKPQGSKGAHTPEPLQQSSVQQINVNIEFSDGIFEQVSVYLPLIIVNVFVWLG